jgi:hypothetical protein
MNNSEPQFDVNDAMEKINAAFTAENEAAKKLPSPSIGMLTIVSLWKWFSWEVIFAAVATAIILAGPYFIPKHVHVVVTSSQVTIAISLLVVARAREWIDLVRPFGASLVEKYLPPCSFVAIAIWIALFGVIQGSADSLAWWLYWPATAAIGIVTLLLMIGWYSYIALLS